MVSWNKIAPILIFISAPFCLSNTSKESFNEAKYDERQKMAEKYLNSLDEAKEDWIDPFRMISHEKEQFLIPEVNPPIKDHELDNDEQPVFSDLRGEVITKNSLSSDESLHNIDKTLGIFAKERHQTCVLDSIYISRWFKKLVLKLEETSSLEPVSIKLPLDPGVLNHLKELSLSDSPIDVNVMDDLICKMVSKSIVEGKEEFDWSLFFIYTWDGCRIVGSVLLLAICAFFLYQCILSRPILTSFWLLILSSIFWHWMQLYLQKKAHKQAELSSMKVPDQCRQQEFGIFEQISHYLKSYFKNTDECKNYYEALMVDPFWEVSFTVATSEAITAILFQPFSIASRSINSAIKNLFNDLPLIGIIFLFIIFLLILIMMCNYKIKFPFFFGALEPCSPVTGSQVQDITPRNRQNMIVSSLSSQVKKSLNVTPYIDHCPSPTPGLFQQKQESSKSSLMIKSELEHPNKKPSSIERENSKQSLFIASEKDVESESDYEVLSENCSCCSPEYLQNEHVDCFACENNFKGLQDHIQGENVVYHIQGEESYSEPIDVKNSSVSEYVTKV